MSVKNVSTVILVFVVILVAALVPVTLPGDFRQAVREDYNESRAYCYQTYGTPDVVNAQAFGRHGGFHCSANENDPHLHEVTQEAKEVALVANETGRSFDELVSERENFQRYQSELYRPGYFGVSMATIILLAVPLVSALVYVNLRYYRRSEDDP